MGYRKISGYLVAIDFEKTCDSMNHAFLIVTHKKYGFADSFIDWMKILLKNRELYVINGGHTTKYFKLKRKAHWGDPISAYLFVLALEIFFIIIETNILLLLKILLLMTFIYTAISLKLQMFLKINHLQNYLYYNELAV